MILLIRNPYILPIYGGVSIQQNDISDIRKTSTLHVEILIFNCLQHLCDECNRIVILITVTAVTIMGITMIRLNSFFIPQTNHPSRLPIVPNRYTYSVSLHM